jgi:hypothetical protein
MSTKRGTNLILSIMSITMNIMTQIFYTEKYYYYLFIFLYNEDTFKGHHCTWHNAYNMHEKEINFV